MYFKPFESWDGPSASSPPQKGGKGEKEAPTPIPRAPPLPPSPPAPPSHLNPARSLWALGRRRVRKLGWVQVRSGLGMDVKGSYGGVAGGGLLERVGGGLGGGANSDTKALELGFIRDDI